ncbi:YlmC/YmxH family sporulation protein [Falsibacillus pallidus]|uniref:YlmC/YmxH family sporulation protein n=1 Tax=Falsibacillus pallidus TaxID=493781 RepID=UPI003D9755B8
MRLSELSGKEIVDYRKAERLGILGHTDLEIDGRTGEISSLIIPTGKWFGGRGRGSEIRVPWNHIRTIGSDMMILEVPD